MGVGSLERLTEITESEPEWREFKLALLSRVGNVNVVSALVLACVFVLGLSATAILRDLVESTVALQHF